MKRILSALLLAACAVAITQPTPAQAIELNFPDHQDSVTFEVSKTQSYKNILYVYDSSQKIRLLVYLNISNLPKAYNYQTSAGEKLIGQAEPVPEGISRALNQMLNLAGKRADCPVSVTVDLNTGTITKVSSPCDPRADINPANNFG